jgi:hypothetical protein
MNKDDIGRRLLYLCAPAVVTVIILVAPVLLATSGDISRGRAIYQAITHHYPGLTLYLQSGLMGENARLVADVPSSKWKVMSVSERGALVAFVQSELATVRASPSRYSLTPVSAPIWPTHRAAFEQICDSCWEIRVGQYNPSTRSLGDDSQTAMKGPAPREPSGSRTMVHAPGLRPLTSANAASGIKLYNAAGVHEVTIVRVDLGSDLIRVRYVRNGATEPKRLSAVAAFWYVKQ